MLIFYSIIMLVGVAGITIFINAGQFKCPKSKTGKHCYHYKTKDVEYEHGFGIEKSKLQVSQCCWCDNYSVSPYGAY